MTWANFSFLPTSTHCTPQSLISCPTAYSHASHAARGQAEWASTWIDTLSYKPLDSQSYPPHSQCFRIHWQTFAKAQISANSCSAAPMCGFYEQGQQRFTANYGEGQADQCCLWNLQKLTHLQDHSTQSHLQGPGSCVGLAMNKNY